MGRVRLECAIHDARNAIIMDSLCSAGMLGRELVEACLDGLGRRDAGFDVRHCASPRKATPGYELWIAVPGKRKSRSLRLRLKVYSRRRNTLALSSRNSVTSEPVIEWQAPKVRDVTSQALG